MIIFPPFVPFSFPKMASKIHRCWFITLGMCTLIAIIAIILGVFLVHKVRQFDFELDPQLRETRRLTVPGEWIDRMELNVAGAGFTLNAAADTNTTLHSYLHNLTFTVSLQSPLEDVEALNARTDLDLSLSSFWSMRFTLPPNERIHVTWDLPEPAVSRLYPSFVVDSPTYYGFGLSLVQGEDAFHAYRSAALDPSSSSLSIPFKRLLAMDRMLNQPNGTRTLRIPSNVDRGEVYFVILHTLADVKPPARGNIQVKTNRVIYRPAEPFVNCFFANQSSYASKAKETGLVCDLDPAVEGTSIQAGSPSTDYHILIQSTPKLMPNGTSLDLSLSDPIRIHLQEHGRMAIYAAVFAPFGSVVVFSMIVVISLLISRWWRRRCERKEQERQQRYFDDIKEEEEQQPFMSKGPSYE